MQVIKLSKFTVTQISFALLGFCDVLLLTRILTPIQFGVSVLVTSTALILYGTFETRWWELLAHGRWSNRISFRQSRTAFIVDFFLVFLVAALASSITSSTQDSEFLWGVAIAVVSLTPIVLNNLRFFLEGSTHNGSGLLVVVIFRLSLTGYLFITFATHRQLELSMLLLFGAAVQGFSLFCFIWFHPLRRLETITQSTSYNFDEEIRSSFLASLASSVYRYSDILLIGYLIGPLQAGDIRSWQLALAPISLYTEIRSLQMLNSDRTTDETPNQSRQKNAAAFLFFCFAAGAGFFFVNLATKSGLDFSLIGLILFLQAVLAFSLNNFRIQLIRKLGYKSVMFYSWYTVMSYLTLIVLFWDFLGGIYLILMVRLLLSVLSVIVLNRRVNRV